MCISSLKGVVTIKCSALNNSVSVSNQKKYFILSFYALSLILFGFLFDSINNIFHGLYKIIIEPDVLITDYIGIGGIGATFTNSGLLMLIAVFILYKLKIHINGVSIASLFTIAGFAMFGKNILNVWIVVFGVYLYVKYQKDKFSKYIYTALFGTCLAPMVSQIMFNINLELFIRIPLALVAGISIGFLLHPLSVYLLRVHQGYNLYNIGFVGGIIGTIYVSVFKSFGYFSDSRLIWTTENNVLLATFLSILFVSMIISGYIIDEESFRKLKDIFTYPGRAITDFVVLEGFAPTIVNMGINGIIGVMYVLIVGGDFNGPTIGGIFTLVGFGAFGKHAQNIWPILLGVFIGSVTKLWNINDPAIVLAALFGTTLAPIAGEFGWKYGIVAGFIHSSVVLNVGALHGGMNLYNNGFAGGIVAAILLPVIDIFRKDEKNEV